MPVERCRGKSDRFAVVKIATFRQTTAERMVDVISLGSAARFRQLGISKFVSGYGKAVLLTAQAAAVCL
jgi:hypothetical protein